MLIITAIFGLMLSDSTNSIVRYIPQSAAHNTSYYKTEKGYFVNRDGATHRIPGLGTASFGRQSGGLLLITSHPRSAGVKLFDGVQFLKEIPFSTLDNPFLIDYRLNRLLVGGFNEDRTTLVFQCLDDKGHLIKEERIAFEDKTVHPRDNYRLASAFLDNQWIVWVPAQLQLLVFDLELQLLNVRDLAIPEQILDIADIEAILFREPDAVKRQQNCESIIGQTIASLPMSLLINDGKLGVVYQSASLVDCGNLVKVRAKEPVKTKIRTEIIYFDKKHFQLEDLSIISGYYADGFYGDPNKFCGREESRGAYHSAVWVTK